MLCNHDPVDDVLESLGNRPWPGDYDNQKLKETIMQQYKMQRTGSLLRSRGVLAATLAFVLLGAVGFTAAGGLEKIRNWIITAEVDGGGTVTIDDDDVTIETDDTGLTTITIDGAEVEGAEDGATVTITAVSTSDGTMTSDHACCQTAKGSQTVVAHPDGEKKHAGNGASNDE